MFETSLIDLEPKKKSRRALILPVALGIHCVALASVTFASYWNVSAIGEPELNAVFVSLVPPPPPLVRRGSDAPKPKPQAPADAPKPEVKPDGPVQPDLEKVAEKVEASAPAQDATAGLDGPGDPEGDRNGPTDGVKWGVEKGVGPVENVTLVPVAGPSVPRVANDEPIHLKAGMTRPALVYQVQPRYTPPAIKAGVQGTVTVEAVIDEQGRVTDVRLLRGLPMGLDQEALAAVRQWRFTPATLQGQPVNVYFSLTVNFRIQR
ncbi:MAG TPA: TonB family protein [Thermoanaerobaculia bacterium]|nr:TonB family protein [Thermoanaerobaculia bacterium]